ncbi:alpha/beta hydrolase [Tsukamurella tyrosinosolvens]|uniref:alpha/beta hydrolase n=1 Tax=Tsukamurella tyrosinosolvens TaxID=57704 RepID=UPI0018D32E16|nr:alpha/beta hydrolase [Tsukamurella tyrosinosolvens]
MRSIAVASLARRDPADGVPLFTRCIEIRKENRVDDRRVLVDFQARRAPSKDKELVVIEGWTHYDLYDQPEPVQQALDHLIPFHKKFL